MTDVVVSVVIPAYNAAAIIARTLESVRSQTFTAYETIVVDDGSADATSEVVRSCFAQHGMRGRILRQDNRGMAAARNAGMREAGVEKVGSTSEAADLIALAVLYGFYKVVDHLARGADSWRKQLAKKIYPDD